MEVAEMGGGRRATFFFFLGCRFANERGAGISSLLRDRRRQAMGLVRPSVEPRLSAAVCIDTYRNAYERARGVRLNDVCGAACMGWESADWA